MAGVAPGAVKEEWHNEIFIGLCEVFETGRAKFNAGSGLLRCAASCPYVTRVCVHACSLRRISAKFSQNAPWMTIKWPHAKYAWPSTFPRPINKVRSRFAGTHCR